MRGTLCKKRGVPETESTARWNAVGSCAAHACKLNPHRDVLLKIAADTGTSIPSCASDTWA